MNAIEAGYDRFCTERFPLPMEEQVADVEQRIGVSLPDDYRHFLLTYNGGYFNEPDIVPPINECPLDGLTFMNGIGASDPSAELATEADLAIFTDNRPVQILPIGYTLMGNLILLITNPDERGSILLKKAFSQEAFFLSSGIEAFFGLLREPAEE